MKRFLLAAFLLAAALPVFGQIRADETAPFQVALIRNVTSESCQNLQSTFPGLTCAPQITVFAILPSSGAAQFEVKYQDTVTGKTITVTETVHSGRILNVPASGPANITPMLILGQAALSIFPANDFTLLTVSGSLLMPAPNVRTVRMGE